MSAPAEHWSTIAELSERIAARTVNPVALTEAMLARIEQLEPSLNAYITLMPESALADARRAQSEIEAGQVRGPLHGVPVAVKDWLNYPYALEWWEEFRMAGREWDNELIALIDQAIAEL